MSELKRELLKSCLAEAVRGGEVAGASLLVVSKGKELAYLEEGLASVEEGKPISRDGIYRCYSMSKVVTSTAAMMLLQDGLIDLFAPISRWFPSFLDPKVYDGVALRPAKKEIDIMDLLSMTSGLPYEGFPAPAGMMSITDVYSVVAERLFTANQVTTAEFAEMAGRTPLVFDPSSSYLYGVSADIIGALVEKVSGMSFGGFLKKRIFDPLGMEETGFSVPEEKRGRLVSVYEDAGAAGEEGTRNYAASTGNGGVRALKLFTGNHLGIRNDGGPNAFESGGAGLFSTIDDTAKLCRMLLDGRAPDGSELLRPGTLRFMRDHHLTPEQEKAYHESFGLPGHSYGNFNRVMNDPARAAIIGSRGEFGWDGWLGTYLTVDPSTDSFFVMMTQKKDYGTGEMTRKLHNIVFSSIAQ